MAIMQQAGSDRVRITMTVTLPEDCPLEGHTGEITSTLRHVDESECECQFIIRSREGAEETHRREAPCSDVGPCIWTVIKKHGAVPILDRIRGDRLTLTTYINEREEACDLFEDLTAVFSEVEVDRLATTSTDLPLDEFAPVDVTSLTEKQREAMNLAVRRGYYANPREVDLDTLADELGISHQALSHRLREAEGSIFEQLFAEENCLTCS